MDKHIATLEELVQGWRTEAQNYVRDNYDEHGVGAIALKSCANQLDAAIALMRGQSEVVTIDLGSGGLLHNALVTGPVRVVAKSGEQVAGNIFQPHGGWEPLVISKDTADEQ